jgi:hypothetical protein
MAARLSVTRTSRDDASRHVRKDPGDNSPASDQPLEKLLSWWSDDAPGSPPIVYLTGPPSSAKTDLIEAFAEFLGGSNTQVIRLRNAATLPSAAELDALIDDIVDGRPAEAARVVIVDDLEDLAARRSGHGKVLLAAADPDGLMQAGCRLVIALSGKPDRIRHQRILPIEVSYVHPRRLLIERITGWIADPHAPGLMLISGPPGSGKSFLLSEAARAADRMPGVRLAHSSIRDWARGEPATMTISDLVNGLATTFAADGLDLAGLAGSLVTAVPGRPIHVVQDIKANYGEVHGAVVVLADPAAQGMETIVAALTARVSHSLASTTLFIVIDALDEWETFGLSALPALRALLSRHEMFQAWNIKILLSGQYEPDWLPPGERVDLADVDARSDLRDFAAARLRGTTLAGHEAERLADLVADLSGGLFLVAAGYIEELADGEFTAEDLAHTPKASTAVAYYADSLRRIRRRFVERGQEDRWRDTERLLAMIAVLPHGRTAADMISAWAQPDVPAGGDWYQARNWAAESPVRRYFVASDANTHYQLVHPALRDALTRMEPWDERASVSAERRRWIRTRTPLNGSGVAWDPVKERVAMAEVGTVLADLASAALSRSPIDETGLEEARGWAQRLLEEWDWIEESIQYADPSDPVPLGLPQVLHQIGLISRADPEFGELTLWTGPQIQAAPPEAVPTNPQVPTAREEGSQQGVQQPGGRPGQPRYAHAHNPLIMEILSGRATFETREAAMARIRRIGRLYTSSKASRDLDDPEQLILFIEEYGLRPEERHEGLRGHYARLWIAADGDGWAVCAEQYAVDGGDPFTKRRNPMALPHWGDPLLRRVRGSPKRKPQPPGTFATVEYAREELKRLKHRYPDAVVDLSDKMLVRVYDKYGPVSPISGKRFTITEVELLVVPADAGYQIEGRIRGYMRSKSDRVSREELEHLPEGET